MFELVVIYRSFISDSKDIFSRSGISNVCQPSKASEAINFIRVRLEQVENRTLQTWIALHARIHRDTPIGEQPGNVARVRIYIYPT